MWYKQLGGLVFIVVLLLAAVLLYSKLTNKDSPLEATETDLFREAKNKRIDSLTLIEPNTVLFSTSIYKYRTRVIVSDPRFLELKNELRESGVEIKIVPQGINYFSWLLFAAPTLLFIGVWIYFARRSPFGGASGSLGGYGKSKAKIFLPNSTKEKKTFADVAGADEAKEELEEIVDFLKDPTKFNCLGGRMPKGVLLVGPPGTGKTLLARAVAGEANVPFLLISGSDFVEMFVGVGASRVRSLFEEGKKNFPCIIFIDEIDAVGGKRSFKSHDEKEQTLNQLLVEMDGFDGTRGIVIIGATNRPDTLDPAILRPGRFDRQVVLSKPDIKGREEILKVHTKKVKVDPEINLHILAQRTPGFAGADLENVVNEAALIAARRHKSAVDELDFDYAIEKAQMGKERKNKDFMSSKEKRTTAFHEAGHTLMAIITPETDRVDKVSVIPRGMALGVTSQLTEDKVSYTESYARGRLLVLMGGQAAEQIVFAEKSSGAKNDISVATDLAKKMVCEWGMSGKVGPHSITGTAITESFLGNESFERNSKLNDLADEEVNCLLNESFSKAKEVLLANILILKQLAEELLEKETLAKKEIDKYYKMFGID